MLVMAAAEEAETAETTTSETTTTTAEEAKPAEPVVLEEKTKPTFDAADHTDWGTYYDPQGEFCGNYDCYKILGFDYENYQSPDRKEITKRYRSLSRAWHPDKSKHKDAKNRFVVSTYMLLDEWSQSECVGLLSVEANCISNVVCVCVLLPLFLLSENCTSL